MLRFAQHDIDEVARIATQSLKGEDVTKLNASESAPTFLVLCDAARCVSAQLPTYKNVGLGLERTEHSSYVTGRRLRGLLPKRKQHHPAYDHGSAENDPWT